MLNKRVGVYKLYKELRLVLKFSYSARPVFAGSVERAIQLWLADVPPDTIHANGFVVRAVGQDVNAHTEIPTRSQCYDRQVVMASYIFLSFYHLKT